MDSKGLLSDNSESTSAEHRDWRDWIALTTGQAQATSDRSLEDVVAGALRTGFRRADLRSEQILLNQRIIDTAGAVFRPGRQQEVDLVVLNGGFVVFEVEIAAKPGDVDEFADKVALMRLLNPDKQVRGVFITLAPENDVRERCQELGIELAR